mmetsp:Transcript_31643/g.72522  ORF Transcript_31643/g.72522 Transcript_31643/m.72522 type:complete len:222 (-) Transcript_31643:1243-1908(-)
MVVAGDVGATSVAVRPGVLGDRRHDRIGYIRSERFGRESICRACGDVVVGSGRCRCHSFGCLLRGTGGSDTDCRFVLCLRLRCNWRAPGICCSCRSDSGICHIWRCRGEILGRQIRRLAGVGRRHVGRMGRTIHAGMARRVQSDGGGGQHGIARRSDNGREGVEDGHQFFHRRQTHAHIFHDRGRHDSHESVQLFSVHSAPIWNNGGGTRDHVLLLRLHRL